ncbi:Crp/Fnr family transcriptional regulator [Gramella lutea]|uniref:Crp/Fnr family transcriptional regulator n=1 Tax=Christiangramia lutea TaxID=1607951 RepID=A0A9X2AA06_9FLAO|nr:Crp/Fnr family transcriptional regulator [Christiangramia lutea]MCH4823885.1 Crp/Fnr family transcriptional regulator [Christiangramia lutea]
MESHLNIDKEVIKTLVNSCTVKEYQKGEVLLQQNDFCEHTFFVEKGLLRQYYLNEEGKEHTILFASESWYLSDRESLYFNRPARYIIEAMENTRVMMLGEAFLQKLSENIPDFTDFNNRLLHNHIRHLQRRIELLLSADAEKRYIEFINTYPKMLPRIPQAVLASYLGITPESLSRIRSKIASK